jgi:hypothetical protein
LALPGLELEPLCDPVHNQSLYWTAFSQLIVCEAQKKKKPACKMCVLFPTPCTVSNKNSPMIITNHCHKPSEW